MIRYLTTWAVISTLCLVGCRTSGQQLLSRTPVATHITTEESSAELADDNESVADEGPREQLAEGRGRAFLAAAEESSESIDSESIDQTPLSISANKVTASNVTAAGAADLDDNSPFNLVLVASGENAVEEQADDNRMQPLAPTVAPPAGNAGDLPPAPTPRSPMDIDNGLFAIEQQVGERSAHAGGGTPISLSEVISSIYQSYPLLEAAIFGRTIAAGDQLSAEGAYDLKLKASSENMPLGYYRNYRQKVGLEQDLYFGGQVFGGYRVGRGEIQPWYQERVTNEGGEFTAGIIVPLAQNRAIDPRRAELWKATYGRSAVEPAIQSQLIAFVYNGSLAYWSWVAAGQAVQYADQLYQLALARDSQLKELVNGGAVAESVMIDNQRLIVSRQVKLIEARQKLQQAAVKLSLFLRTDDGMPVIADDEHLPMFPEPLPVNFDQLPADITDALSRRPELRELDFDRRIAEIDLAQAHNLTQPELDATFWGAQDVGAFSSSKGDKQPLELEGILSLSMPLQRRKAQGKIFANEGKIAQIQIKRKYTQDKIETEVRNATIALNAAYQSLAQARRSVALNIQMQELEAIQLEEGSSDLLRLNLREEQTFQARLTEVEALFLYFQAQAELRAAMGLDADGVPSLPGSPMPEN